MGQHTHLDQPETLPVVGTMKMVLVTELIRSPGQVFKHQHLHHCSVLIVIFT